MTNDDIYELLDGIGDDAMSLLHKAIFYINNFDDHPNIMVEKDNIPLHEKRAVQIIIDET